MENNEKKKFRWLKFVPLALAVIAITLLILTNSFNGTLVWWDNLTPIFILLAIAAVVITIIVKRKNKEDTEKEQ